MKKVYFLPPFLLQTIIWIPVRLLFKIFIHLEIVGLEKLASVKGPVIFAANHVNELDPVMIPAALPFFSRFKPMFYTSRESKHYDHPDLSWRRHLYGGRFFEAWGAYAVRSGMKNYAVSLEPHVRILCDGGSLYVFPEGGISRDGNLREAHGGIMYLADVTGVPIVPVAINSLFQLGPKQFLSGHRHVRMTFGAPIYAKEILQPLREGAAREHTEYKNAAKVVMERIGEMLY